MTVRDYDGTEYSDVEDGSSLVGAPDGFQRLWTPHRIAYIERSPAASGDDCVFCRAPDGSDEDSLIVARGVLAYVVLNLFPYNSGHLLVVPYRHVATYDSASTEEVAEIGGLTQTAMRVLTATARAEGFNVGMNQGAIAGAGIAAHLHQHVVPRWSTDSNFFPIVAQTKAIPRLLGEVRDEIAAAWPRAGA